jgi:integrase
LRRCRASRNDEIASDLRAYYRTTKKRNMVEAEKRLKHLDTKFKNWRVAAIDPPAITAYVQHRQEQKAANGTINRELAVLCRMLRLAYENNKLARVPVLRKLKEADPRSGFFEAEQFNAVRKYLPDDVQTAVTIAYTYGWRMQSEVLSLERRHLDLETGTLRLDPGMTKNGKGRVVYLTPELKTLLGAPVARVKALERKLERVIPWLFPYFDNEPHVSRRLVGTQRADFRKAWLTACRKAGVPGRLRHDFRRTAARNLIRAGVPERVAMTVTGHLTRSVFDRYNIVSSTDLQEATRRISAATAL